jgi:hypothetical protein
LKKNAWEIPFSHIKNKFKDKAILAFQYIRKLIVNYQWFKIIDNSDNKPEIPQTKSKHEKLISSVLEDTQEQKDIRIKKDKLLNILKKISEIENLWQRIEKYINLFEKLEWKFSDKKFFAEELEKCIKTHANIQIEKEIQKILRSIIQDNLRLEKTGLYWYFVYKLNRDSRRIIAYPNWEIFAICPHEEYEKIINSQPPIDRIE